MKEFINMFPDIDPFIIEMTLRKHEGDVSLTIDELLNLNSTNNLPNTPSSSNSIRRNVISSKGKYIPKNEFK